MTSLDTKLQVHTANLEGRGSSGKFEPHFNGENGSEREKYFVRVIYASETIQNCKNLTGHVDTLMFKMNFYGKPKIKNQLSL